MDITFIYVQFKFFSYDTCFLTLQQFIHSPLDSTPSAYSSQPPAIYRQVRQIRLDCAAGFYSDYVLTLRNVIGNGSNRKNICWDTAASYMHGCNYECFLDFTAMTEQQRVTGEPLTESPSCLNVCMVICECVYGYLAAESLASGILASSIRMQPSLWCLESRKLISRMAKTRHWCN